jgi:hypothetical protein
VTVDGSAVVASEGNAEMLVDELPACSLVSFIEDKVPPDPDIDNVTDGFKEY